MVGVQETTERFQDTSDRYTELNVDIADMEEIGNVLSRIVHDVHPLMQRAYPDVNKGDIFLTRAEFFLIAFAAACGYTAHMNNPTMLQGAIEKLIDLLKML